MFGFAGATPEEQIESLIRFADRMEVERWVLSNPLHADPTPEQFRDANDAVLRALGLTTGRYRVAQQNVPTSGLMYDFVDFDGTERRTVPGRIQDFGSTRVQLRVRDIDAAIASFERVGGEVVSTGGRPLALPAGNATLQVAIVRDPNNLFVVLIEAPPG